MKRLFLFIILSTPSVFFQLTHAAWYDACELKSFKATAYYSPEEGQAFYVKWSLEEDKILNGDWTHGASGRAVFNGMVAAPKSYAFGTRLYIPWRWIGQVEDRWWAIVEAWERNESYDRLDFWAGKWQAWLDAALRFWVRYFDAYVCPKGVWGNELGFSFSQIPLERKLPVSLREIDLSPGMISSWTPILQRYLKTLWYMTNVPESFHYGEQTRNAVCLYQQKVMGIASTSEWCGWFWQQTRLSLQESLKSFAQIGKPDNTHEQQKNWPDLAVSTNHPDQEATRALAKTSWGWDKKMVDNLPERLFAEWGEFDGYLLGPLQPGDSWQEVRILQRKLQWLGHYPKDLDVTWVYDAQTIRSVYSFQLAQWLLLAEIDTSVYGYLWPKTRAKINSV